MSKRADHHAPGSLDFDPQTYDYVMCWDFGGPGEIDPEDRRIMQEEWNACVTPYESRGYTFTGERGQCAHCGQWLRYAAVMVRHVSRELVFVGQTCLDQRFSGVTAEQFRAMQKRAAEQRAKQLIKQGVRETCERHPLVTELTYGPANPLLNWTDKRYNDFLHDVGNRFMRTGKLSEKQIGAVERCIMGAMKYTARVEESERKRAAERAQVEESGVTYPDGRTTVTGTILMTRWYENDYGETLKMTVKDDRGFLVFLSVPNSILAHADKGKRVRFDAALTVSPDDGLFGFGKRPTKASILD